mmetsp:Transcript_14791/g.25630  ORF Transcript_14791/g.25630 Transcript_14791/m.25630 type:complete len:90 (+) Transcript_14791:1247-1516(+)
MILRSLLVGDGGDKNNNKSPMQTLFPVYILQSAIPENNLVNCLLQSWLICISSQIQIKKKNKNNDQLKSTSMKEWTNSAPKPTNPSCTS